MQYIIVTLFKALKKIRSIVLKKTDKILGYIVFYINGVKISSIDEINGMPKIVVARGAECIIGSNFVMTNREICNPIGRFNKCSIALDTNAKLTIGNNVGMSSTAINCQSKITIGNYVKIGGNVVIYDTDFHALDKDARRDKIKDYEQRKTKPVVIEDNVFIGAHSTILKGVTIGENSIIGACSVVTKPVPPNEIWAGNPAKKIRDIN